MMWTVGLEVALDTLVELAGPADVTVAEMIEGHGGLDESLVELSRWAAVFRPQLFPDLMALVVVALVEFLDPLQVEGIVAGGVQGQTRG